jgi:hypothetical protein
VEFAEASVIIVFHYTWNAAYVRVVFVNELDRELELEDLR